MMFKKAMADLVLQRKKTQTRRLPSHSSKVYREGSIQPIQFNYHDKAVGHIKILETFMQPLNQMTEDDAKAEGFNNWYEFMAYLRRINGEAIPETEVVRVYKFELVDPKPPQSTESR